MDVKDVSPYLIAYYLSLALAELKPPQSSRTHLGELLELLWHHS